MDAGLLNAWSAVDYKFFLPSMRPQWQRIRRRIRIGKVCSVYIHTTPFDHKQAKKNVKVAGSLTVRISVVNDRSGIHDFLSNQSINQSINHLFVSDQWSITKKKKKKWIIKIDNKRRNKSNKSSTQYSLENSVAKTQKMYADVYIWKVKKATITINVPMTIAGRRQTDRQTSDVRETSGQNFAWCPSYRKTSDRSYFIQENRQLSCL